MKLLTRPFTKRLKALKNICVCLLFGGQALLAQTKSAEASQGADSQIRGNVVTDKGIALPGVTVDAGNTETHEHYFAVSDETGAFIFKRLPAGKYELSFSSVGYYPGSYKGLVVKAAGQQDAISIRLKENRGELNEVVVTALGIKRSEKSLGYAAQTVSENAVKDAKTNNWVNSLSGKVAGLNIQGTGAGPMGSSRITLRGENSLNLDNNQALIVMDGVPISNKITGTGFNGNLSADVTVDFGSDISDINPDDIESITVLKGPGATALYGSRAAGGALIITTKSGARKDKGLGITFNTNNSIDRVNRWPDYQYEYGEGRTSSYYSYGNSADGVNTGTAVAAGRAWGPKFMGQSYFQYDPTTPNNLPTTRTPWHAYKDYISGFFRTGFTTSNSLAIEGGNENGSSRLSVSQLKNSYIIPNTGYDRLSAALSVSQKVTDQLKINGKATYTHKTSNNLPSAGYNNQTYMYFMAIGTAPSINHNWFKPYWLPGLVGVQQKNSFNPGPDNPYIDIYEDLNKLNKDGLVGNVSATYNITRKLDLLVRTGVDMAYEFHSQQRPYSITKYPKGMYREVNIFNLESNSDFLLTYKDRVGGDISFTASGGGNAMHQRYDYTGLYADQLAQPGVYQISNSLNQAVSDPQRTRKSINSLYASTQWAYKERIFLDVTGRNDWSSTLPYANCSFFYPSVSTSFLLSDLFSLPAAINFAKFRLSWAQVGNDTRPYQTSKYYNSIYGNNFTNPTTLYNPDLKPEIITSYEAGLDLRMFQNRFNIDLAVYNNRSRNQILAIPLDQVSGYNSALLNAGLIESRGAEVQLKVVPVVTKNFKWTSTINWSINRSYVRRLTAGITNQVVYADGSDVTIEARVGGRMGDMYGKGFQRSPDGKVIYTAAGLPVDVNPITKKWGNAFADWRGGWNNELVYKNIRFAMLWDYSKGGKMYSQTNYKNNALGKTKVTLPGRDNGIVGDGVVLDASGKYVPNTAKAAASAYYELVYSNSNAEMNIFDATWLKLREARLEFNLPPALLSKISIRQASVAIYGRDLLNITKFPGFDPEGGNLNSGTLTPGVELMQFPSTRNMGINLTFKF
ncbi:MAG TPA: SusC/RagA family TonB-linked outer membrane protein [Puia sp.]|nr:SusC/RagA family TonB-linked outer membrane protein [Puia sp.]